MGATGAHTHPRPAGLRAKSATAQLWKMGSCLEILESILWKVVIKAHVIAWCLSVKGPERSMCQGQGRTHLPGRHSDARKAFSLSL